MNENRKLFQQDDATLDLIDTIKMIVRTSPVPLVLRGIYRPLPARNTLTLPASSLMHHVYIIPSQSHMKPPS